MSSLEVAKPEHKKSLEEMLNISMLIEDMICRAGGELTPELEHILDVSKGQLEAKLDSFKFVEDRLENMNEFYKAKAATYSKLAKGFDNAKSKLRDRLLNVMTMNHLTEINGQEGRYVLCNGKDSLDFDESVLPQSYKIIRTEMIPDKEKIRADLELCKQVTGAKLVPTQYVRHYYRKK